MKKIALAAIALSFIATPAAFAQQHPDHGYRHGHSQKEVIVKKTVTVKKTHWSRGKQFPPSYRRHVVRDYHRYDLRTPPHGYRWVKADNDYMMVSFATGIVSALVQAR